MNSSKNVFNGEKESIEKVDIDEPLAGAKIPCCDYYIDAYAKAAQHAREKGDISSEQVFRFLQCITSLWPSFETPATPFKPLFQWEGGRSCLPKDLTLEDIEVIQKLLTITKDYSLRARLFDVLWETVFPKNHRFCTEAVHNYIASAERLNVSKQWTYSVRNYHRALYLASKLGRKNEMFNRASESIQQAVRNPMPDEEVYWCYKFLKLLYKFQCGNAKELAQIANKYAEKYAVLINSRASRFYYEIAADFFKIDGNASKEALTRQLAAKAYITEADNTNTDALARASLLQQGIEALRRIKASPEIIETQREHLAKIQDEAVAQMQTLSYKMDITKPVEAAVEHVKDASLRQAIRKFAYGIPLTDPNDIRESVIKNTKEFPLRYMMETIIQDERGRTLTKMPPLLELQGIEYDNALKQEMFSFAARYYWPIRLQTYIYPGCYQILNDHHPTMQELAFLVQDNQFVPPAHENIYLRGIHAGFYGDFLISSHLLIPQIENSMRYVLECKGVDVSNLLSDGTQPVKILGALFDMPQTQEFFGERLCFELRGCLIEKTGCDFRNQLAHGFVSASQCYSWAPIMLWWLTLRILAFPVYYNARQKGANGN